MTDAKERPTNKSILEENKKLWQENNRLTEEIRADDNLLLTYDVLLELFDSREHGEHRITDAIHQVIRMREALEYYRGGGSGGLRAREALGK